MTQTVISRTARIDNATNGLFDVIILGGGIHGACAAREIALRGGRVLLLEAYDFAYGTSSRSSKLLHGGVRYLEQGNVNLVSHALQEREILCRAAPHLTRSLEFLFPIIQKRSRPGWQVRLGLLAYDFLAHSRRLLVRNSDALPRHQQLSRRDPRNKHLQELGLSFSALFSYFDAQVDDTRFVIENVLDADLLGATTLNHARVFQIEQRPASDGPQWTVRWECKRSKQEFESNGAFLLNLTGPWGYELHRLAFPGESPGIPVRYSRGTHLLFAKPWNGPGLILPTDETGRYYFVLPYFAAGAGGTLVGTTDRELSSNEEDPQPSSEETAELLSYLARDLPASGLDEKSIARSFAGIRILAAPNGAKDERSSELSREEIILRRQTYALLVGGKYTTARRTIERLVDEILPTLTKDRVRKDESTRIRLLPGANGWSAEYREEMVKKVSDTFRNGTASGAFEMPLEKFAAEAVDRFGARSMQLVPHELGMKDSKAGVEQLIRAQVRLCVAEEQAWSVGDVVRRRLGLDLRPDLDSQTRRQLQRIVVDELTTLGLSSS